MAKQKKTVAQPDLRVYKEVEKVKQQLSVYEKLKQFFNQFNIF
jgi:hypothetical protein